jgi:hypothetical protein
MMQTHQFRQSASSAELVLEYVQIPVLPSRLKDLYLESYESTIRHLADGLGINQSLSSTDS